MEESTLIEDTRYQLDNLIQIKEATVQKRKDLWELQQKATGSEYSAIMNERSELYRNLSNIENSILFVKNIIQVLEFSGDIIQINDKKGQVYDVVPDFRNIDTTQIIFEEDTILKLERPQFVPLINEEAFEMRGFVFDAIRISNDSYILAIIRHEETNLSENKYVVVTLDQLVLIADYYLTKARATNKQAANAKNKRAEEQYDNLPVERREKFMNQNNFYNSIPAAVKKKVTKEQWEALTLEEKEKLYKPFKKHGAKKLSSKLEENQMWTSFHKMFERFLDPTAISTDKDGTPNPKGRYANPIVFMYWRKFREMMDFKIKDIKIQRDELSENYKAAIETSFGESNSSFALKDRFGFLVKRQNGAEINPAEISQIEDAYTSIMQKLGDLKPSLERYSIKVSHTGKKNVFASKAIGAWVATMGTIAVSDKYGDSQFRSTFSHELAHFMDFASGQQTGKRYASDDYESTAGILAFTFRDNMNKSKSQQTDYVNATKECFARAFQQYYGIEVYGEDSGVVHSYIEQDEVMPFFFHDNFVSKESYYNEIKPLIEKFISENEEIFANASISHSDEINDAITALELLFETSDNSEKPNIAQAIQSLRILIN